MNQRPFTKKIKTYATLEVGDYVVPLKVIAPMWRDLPAQVIEARHHDADRFGHAVVLRHVDGRESQTYSNYLSVIPPNEAFLMLLKSKENG